jgi:ABC-type amino acid transport substrate-binding protein
VVGLIRGFSYSGSENFGHIVNIKTEEQLLEMLNLKRIDVAIVNKQVAEYYIKKKQLNLVIGPLHDEKTLHIRINKLNAELLPKLNSVINQIIQSGERDELINKYLNK